MARPRFIAAKTRRSTAGRLSEFAQKVFVLAKAAVHTQPKLQPALLKLSMLNHEL
jgi:hypothetical protein